MLSRRLLRIKIVKALYAHFKSESDSLASTEKSLLFSIDKTYELYHQMLWLVVDVASYAEQRIELGRRKKLPSPEELHPNTKFIDNRAIAALRSSERLTDYLERKSLGWANSPELIKRLYGALLESDYYQKYMEKSSHSFREDVALVEKFYTQTACDDPLLESVVEEQSIYWSDDIDFATIMVVRTLSDMKASQTEAPLVAQYKNQEDRFYVVELFRHALVHFKEYADYLGKFTSNWEVDRIAFMDTVIMVAAMSELIVSKSIPVKVTLDEFIEISKYYSTPGSTNFINGVMDKVVEALTAEQRIQKVGRGLLDSKASADAADDEA
ncbi:MAG: transcription antitermination factor NusB [Alistipes sp.]|nr:transcription antitermination factor NusB [Alistipes sp.]